MHGLCCMALVGAEVQEKGMSIILQPADARQQVSSLDHDKSTC